MCLPYRRKNLVIRMGEHQGIGRGTKTLAAVLPGILSWSATLMLAAIALALMTLGGCAPKSGTSAMLHLPPAQAPQWKKGDFWVFSARTRSPFVLAERMEVTSMGDSIVLTGDQDPKKHAVLLADFSVKESEGGMLNYDVQSGKDAYLFFPLAVGDSRTFSQVTNTKKGTQSYTNTVTVEAAEEVTVPAGTFKTFRVVVNKKNTTGWSGVYRMWYAPDLGYFVRVLDTHGNVAELKSFGHL